MRLPPPETFARNSRVNARGLSSRSRTTTGRPLPPCLRAVRLFVGRAGAGLTQDVSRRIIGRRATCNVEIS